MGLSRDKELAAVAHHEAGHAVVAWALGLKVEYVNVLDGGASADTECATKATLGLDSETHLDGIRKDITVALAGAHAQLRHRPRKANKRQLDEWDDDRNLAPSWAHYAALVASGMERGQISIETLKNLTPDQLEYANRLFQECAARAFELVAEHWSAIAEVAKALLICPVLNADDLNKILGVRRSTHRETGNVGQAPAA